MFASVIIIAKNHLQDLTVPCIASVLSNTHLPLELICVDDGSTDGTFDYFSRVAHKALRNRESRGVAASRNLGLAAADPRAGFACFLDNDTQVPAGWLGGLSNAIARPLVGIAGGIPSNELGWRASLPRGHDGLIDVGYVAGACMAISRPTLNKLGFFDESFVNCGEDQDYAYRAHLWGLAHGDRIRVVSVPWVIIPHKAGGTIIRTGNEGVKIRKCQERFWRKWANSPVFSKQFSVFGF